MGVWCCVFCLLICCPCSVTLVLLVPPSYDLNMKPFGKAFWI